MVACVCCVPTVSSDFDGACIPSPFQHNILNRKKIQLLFCANKFSRLSVCHSIMAIGGDMLWYQKVYKLHVREWVARNSQKNLMCVLLMTE